jgi:hypothetical protein
MRGRNAAIADSRDDGTHTPSLLPTLPVNRRWNRDPEETRAGMKELAIWECL